MLLIILLLIPIAGAFLLYFDKVRAFVNIPLAASLVNLILGLWGLKGVFGGAVMECSVQLPAPFAPAFRADSLSAVFVILVSFVWLAVCIYLPGYMQAEGKTKSFELCTLLTFSAILGIFLAADMLTMLLFFELMTVSSFFWIIHRFDKKSIWAGYYYLFFSIAGGLFISLGIGAMSVSAGALPVFGAGAVTPSNYNMFSWSVALFLIGFGIKAGIVPLHLWLPHAHSAAPTPGSALLSGLLIKVGAYGLIRVISLIGWKAGSASMVGWIMPALIVIGMCSMLTGVIAALLQSDAKRLLAYHSVSQMGYIVLGFGIALMSGTIGSMAMLGSVYHMVNHALFKSALFLGVGVIYFKTKETNLYNLGGLWRKFPLTALFMLIAVFGITGTPGFNGYVSKTLLHHALSAAAENGGLQLRWAEKLFLAVGVGTAASFAKLYYLIFFGKPAKVKITGKTPWGMQLAIGLITVVMAIIGFTPKLFPNLAGIGAVAGLGMENVSADLSGLSFWGFSDVLSMVITLIVGVLICWGGLSSGLFHIKVPAWLTLEGLFKLAGQSIYKLCQAVAIICKSKTSAINTRLKAVTSRLLLAFHKFDTSKTGSLCGVKLTGISADAAILIVLLALLLAFYTILK
ncbi:MAG: hypothetical protein M0R40_07065 [Firmicutes bacterium]|nr:hypothetical protein [Bacillota bacterium]